MSVKPIELSENEREQLQTIIKKRSDWRERDRAQTILMLKEKGMRFYFLPPYSPELNRIELLSHKMKYEWLPFKTFTPDELEQVIDEIGRGFGSKYTLTFC
jgi:transposase